MRIQDYLDEVAVPYTKDGKNTTSGDIEICCPFCDDPSMHLGINLNTGIFHCWVCNETGNMVKLARELEKISWSAAKKRIENFSKAQLIGEDIVKIVETTLKPKGKENKVKFEYINLPIEVKEIKGSSYSLLWKFLEQRKITIEMVNKYDLCYCESGRYRDRLIIPIYNMVGDLLGFTSRDMTGKSKVKYVHPKGFPIKNYLYNIDIFEGRTLILVEGCIDAMRIGEGAVALFNSEMSVVQKKTICYMNTKKMFDELIIALDSDAYFKAFKMGEELKAFGIKKVKVLQLPTGKDPADLGRKELLILNVCL